MLKYLVLLLLLCLPCTAWAQALDGSNATSSSSGTTATVSLTTAHAPDLVCVGLTAITATDFVSVSSPTVGSFTKKGSFSQAGSIYREVWCGSTATNLSSETITITLGSTASFFNAIAWAFSGIVTPATFDPNGSLPYQGITPVVSTTYANDIIFASINCGGTATPTAGAGWTGVQPGNYNFMEYQLVSSAQTSLSVTTGGTGGGACGVTNTVAHAIEVTPSGGATHENVLMGVM